MTEAPDAKVTTEILWRGALVFALIDAVFVTALSRVFKRERLRSMKWVLVGTMVVFFTVLWGTLASFYFWDPVYHYFFPESMRWILPPLFGLLLGAIGFACWWLAMRLPGNGVVSFCLLGGPGGLITHLWAAYRGIFSKPPMLQGASPVAGVTIAIFEFIFYWCVCLSVASLLQAAWMRMKLFGE